MTPEDEIHTSDSFCGKMSCFVVSKALLISNNTTSVSFLLSVPPKMASVVCISGLSVEWNFLFPLCVTAVHSTSKALIYLKQYMNRQIVHGIVGR